VSYSIGSAILSEEDCARAVSHLTHATIDVEPASRVVRPYQKLHCRVRITIPEGDEPPHDLYAVLRSRGIFCCRDQLVLNRRDGTEYALEATLRAPTRLGMYRLGLEAEYSVLAEATGEHNGSAGPLTGRTVHHKIDGPEIRVRK